FQELAAAGGAAEDLAELRVQTGRGAGNQPDRGGGCDGHQRGVADPAGDLCAEGVPVQARRAVDLDGGAAVGLKQVEGVDRHHALAPAAAREVGVGAALTGQVGGGVDGVPADELHHLVHQLVGL